MDCVTGLLICVFIVDVRQLEDPVWEALHSTGL